MQKLKFSDGFYFTHSRDQGATRKEAIHKRRNHFLEIFLPTPLPQIDDNVYKRPQ